jgi:hypothetical protein
MPVTVRPSLSSTVGRSAPKATAPLVLSTSEKEVLREHLENRVWNEGLKPLSSPPDLTGFRTTCLYDERPVDGFRVDVWAKGNKVFAKFTQEGMGMNRSEQWFGPMDWKFSGSKNV